LQTKTQARAHARALVGAVAIGSTLGFALGGAYLAGGATRGALAQARAERVAAASAGGVALAPAHAMTQIGATAQQGPAVQPDLKNASLRAGFQKTALKVGAAAKPFTAAAGKRDLDCLTSAVYYEARGEGVRGQEAVAQVILNRVRHPAFPKSVCAVVYQGCQFSFTCNGAMRRGHEGAAWNEARKIASRALGGFVLAGVGNATHFHTTGVSPAWGGMVRVAQIGAHVFYRFGGSAGRSSTFNARRVVASAAATYKILGPTRSKAADLTLASADTSAPYTVLGPSSRQDAQATSARTSPVLTPTSAPRAEAPASAIGAAS
jgi:spore germination cell wall hydrolase CwlJ-like protein